MPKVFLDAKDSCRKGRVTALQTAYGWQAGFTLPPGKVFYLTDDKDPAYTITSNADGSIVIGKSVPASNVAAFFMGVVCQNPKAAAFNNGEMKQKAAEFIAANDAYGWHVSGGFVADDSANERALAPDGPVPVNVILGKL
jgi:hypothetical protein